MRISLPTSTEPSGSNPETVPSGSAVAAANGFRRGPGKRARSSTWLQLRVAWLEGAHNDFAAQVSAWTADTEPITKRLPATANRRRESQAGA